MYSLLIVDDEYQARMGLRELFDWESIGIRVAADASDGDEAAELLQTLRPDILLTDVRMNRMGGIELARQARRLLPQIAIVFISGYSDAEYLRDALHVEAVDYIYKPVRLTELHDTMSRLLQRLDEKKQLLQKQEQTRELLEKSKPLLIERFLHSWFHGLMDDRESVRAKMDLLGLHFPQGTGVLGIAFQPEWTVFPDDGQAENGQIVLERAVRSGMERMLTCAQDTGVVALAAVSDEHEKEAVFKRLQAIRGDICRQVGTDVLVGVGCWHADWMEAPQAIREAQQAIAHQLQPCDAGVLLYEHSVREAVGTPGLLDGELLDKHLLASNYEAMWTGVERALADEGNTAASARKLLMSVALRVDQLLKTQGVKDLDALAFCRRALGYTPVLALRRLMQDYLKEACALMEQQRSRTYTAVVNHVMGMIHTRYSEHLSVNAMAEEVHYSPAHLSTLFRKETGFTLSEVLLQTRLKAAMELLQTTAEPVSRIGIRCGYADVQYFSRVFKQCTGLTPLEYRRKVPPC